METIRRSFNSPTELLAIAGDGKGAYVADYTYLASRQGDREFRGTNTWEEAVKVSENGWPEAPKLEGLSNALEGLSNALLSSGGGEDINIAHDVEGAFVDVGAFVTGQPECMINFMPRESKRPVRLVVNVGVNCGTSKEAIAWRGAVVLALYDSLRAAGHVAEIWAGWRTVKGGYDVIHEVMVQASDRSLDQDRLAFWLCHASVLRRFFFAMLEHEDKAVRQVMYGYGKATPYDDEDGAIVIREAKNLPTNAAAAKSMYDRYIKKIEKLA